MNLKLSNSERVANPLDRLEIELPSWGFANTGTRFGKFLQPAAESMIEEKFSDAGQIHSLTGVCQTMALHVLWDLPEGPAVINDVKELSIRFGVRSGSINPNVFQDQIYKHGWLGNRDPLAREAAVAHLLESADIAAGVGSRDISLWFADGSNYPGTANICHRRRWFAGGLAKLHERLGQHQRMLVEHEPFEPAIRGWARWKGLPEDPMKAFRQSGYLEKITSERREKNAAGVTSYA